MRLTVDTAAGALSGPGGTYSCAIGAKGACPAGAKREGDGMTPLGRWPIRGALIRRDRLAVPDGIHLPWRGIRPDDGWSDDPADPSYNRPVRHPHRFSAERMWREDGLYDVVIILGHNDTPPVPGLGSAIFLHLRGDRPTEGCIAIARGDMLALLPVLSSGDEIEIV